MATKWVPIRLNGVSSGRPHNNSESYIHVGLYFHFFCQGWSDPAAPTNMPSPFSRFGVVGWTLTQVSLWEVVWVFKEFSFPLLTPSFTYPPNSDLTYLPPSTLLLISYLPTYQSPTYLFPCALPHSCTRLIFHVFFLFG